MKIFRIIFLAALVSCGGGSSSGDGASDQGEESNVNCLSDYEYIKSLNGKYVSGVCDDKGEQGDLELCNGLITVEEHPNQNAEIKIDFNDGPLVEKDISFFYGEEVERDWGRTTYAIEDSEGCTVGIEEDYGRTREITENREIFFEDLSVRGRVFDGVVRDD